ncbi:MAG: DUF2490 domain-containing protein [Puia sp.]|nr:DUF2490 domain-containing protein [Puia sp.]
MKNSMLTTLSRLRRCLLLSLPLTGGVVNISFAQTQFMGWGGTFQNIHFSGKTGLWFDGQVRSTDQAAHVQSLLLRPGVNFYLTKNLTATAGYAHVHHRKSVGPVTGYLAEHRSWQQLLFSHPVHAATVTHRLRLEQRYLPVVSVQGNALDTDGYTYAGRLRYFTRGVLPVNGEKKFRKGYFAALQNELFVNMGDNSVVNGKFFDQNRAYIALGYRAAASFDIEVGYMNQYISGAGDATTNNHILQCATYLRL